MRSIVRTPIFKQGMHIAVQCIDTEALGRITDVQHDGTSEPLYTVAVHGGSVTALEYRCSEIPD